jgi:hypothetical protein
MPTQKTLKRRVRTRMAKTGESYTAARRQLLAKADAARAGATEAGPPAEAAEATEAGRASVSDTALRRATGRGHDEWFAILDGWAADQHSHTEIARWLHETHGVPGWWTQTITVDYERARGLRARHEMADGFSVGATRTIAVSADRCLAAFTDPRIRGRWLPGPTLRQRPTRAARTARFDWADPPSRVVVYVEPKGDRKATVAVQHEQLPDAASGDRLKVAWRGWLGELKAVLEGA